ncbi:phosphonate C-P lyase system protein PhnG [Nonomuraea rubra]|uniref:Alpha-D-ribose 1-methylphosphonate 5-triphosphate synthase subunit PhnG n=1 Tax=Nonomuraea rubra TaxID=46180 RepID=A0A7X0TYE6_9ACTN|nr:phosphonate C-P lyase system protein PhnG [Nonomuraea rubra]MBB6548368.1 alpha-D-ribose 1-methylphosphonate 5-triphosphate synthase subunit PhnG [Nonomuraea rubra]
MNDLISREERAGLLASATPGELLPLAERLLQSGELGEPTVLRRPEVGMVMLTVREPVAEERFHLGEVLVTSCTVEVAGAAGWCMRGGDDRVAALAAALLDAAAEAGLPAAGDVHALCAAVAERRAREDAAEWAEVSMTRVAFEELT